MRSFIKHFAGKIRKALAATVPHTIWGDYILCLIRFLRAYHRFPKPPFRSFHDTLFWIKTSSELQNPLRVFVTDKEFVKIYVRAMVGDQYNIPTLGVIRGLEEALHFDYPVRCVIKPTHLSGEVIFRKKGESVGTPTIQRWFRTNFYSVSREANYRQLAPKVIIEPFVFGSSNASDFKFFCVNGVPKMIQVDYDRHTNHKRCLFDCHWSALPFSIGYPIGVPLAKPDNLPAMLNIAAVLSKYFNFIRVDLYSDGKDIFVGELTNCHGSGLESFCPAELESAADALLFA